MKRLQNPLTLGLLVALLGPGACTPRRTPAGAGPQARRLAYYRAKLTALDLEIQRHEQWLKTTGDPQKRLAYQKNLARLRVEQERWRTLSPDTIPLPRDTLQVVVSFPPEGCHLGQVLPYEGLSRSGPFYIVAGIVGDSCQAIRPGHRYRLTLVPVLPQAYPFPSSYVCILAYQDLGPAP